LRSHKREQDPDKDPVEGWTFLESCFGELSKQDHWMLNPVEGWAFLESCFGELSKEVQRMLDVFH